jgi:DNA topoisomerase-1
VSEDSAVAKNLVIVESPAKAKTIEKYLGKDFRVEASMGHVRDLPQKTLGVDVEHNFKPEYEILRGKMKVLGSLQKAVKSAATVYMATDLDREGEAIAWHLCEALGLAPGKVHRVVFNEITKSAITEAFAQPGHINMDKVSAQEARRILDRLVGYKLSPLLWKKVAQGLSAGRVQSVAVRLVVEREREIRNFKPEEYWTITALLSRRGQDAAFKALLAAVNGETFRPTTGDAARAIGERLRRAAYRVLAIRKKTLQEKAPPPFITSELQRAASTQLGFPAKKTMSIAQALYQGVELGPEGSVALITYMRTDSYHVAPGALAAARELIGKMFGPAYVPEKPMVFKSRGRAQEAHEAIRPTDVARTPDAVRPYLDAGDARLYELIWKRFIASQMKSAVWDVTEADVEAAEGDLRGLFKARGRALIFDGHTRVSGIRLGENDQQLPTLAEGDPLDLKDLAEEQHFTQPPDRFTEATLVRRLESLGIGRPSTYAAIISTIQDRGYVVQEKNFFLRCENYPQCACLVPCDLRRQPLWPTPADKKCACCGNGTLVPKEGKRCFYATDLGEVVTDKLVRHFPDILDVQFTGHMEDQLDDVEEAKTQWLTVVREFWEPFSADLQKASEEMESAKHQPVEEAGPCPQCSAPLVKRWSKRGPFLGCSKYPDCKYTRPLDSDEGATQAAQAAEEAGPCPLCGAPLVSRMSQRGPFLGCSKYPDCKFTRPLEGPALPAPKATEHKCQKCGGTMLLRYNRRGEPFLGCDQYPKCRSTLPCDAEGNPQRPEPTGEVCEKCGAPMVVKISRRGPFLACSAYPKCRNAKSLHKAAKAGGAGAGAKAAARAGKAKPAAKARRAPPPKPVATDRTCPDCGAVLVVRSGRRGPFLGCSRYPTCRHTEDAPPGLA